MQLLRRGAVCSLILLLNLAGAARLHAQAPGTWTATGSMETARHCHTAALLPSEQVLVAGGARGFLASAELYTSVTSTE
jgi:hypothetical protein